MIFPIVAMGLELIAILLVFFWGIGARVVLRRPWTIRAAEALGRGEEHPRPAEALPA